MGALRLSALAAPGYELAEPPKLWTDGKSELIYRFAADRRCVSIPGILTDAAGKPAPGVEIVIAYGYNRSPQLSTTSGPDGRFTLSTMPNRQRPGMAIWPTRNGSQIGPVVPVSAEQSEVQLKLYPTGIIAVEVLAWDRQPVPGAMVVATGRANLERLTRLTGITYAQGRFTSSPMPAGEYNLHVELPYARIGEPPPPLSIIKVAADQITQLCCQCRPLPPVVKRPRACGTLVDAADQPLRRCLVNLLLRRQGADGQEQLLYG